MKNYLQSKGDEVKKIIRNWGVLDVASVYYHRVLELWEYLCSFTSCGLGISLDCQIFKHRTILALSNWPRFKIQTFTSISKRYHLCIRPVHANCFDRGSNPQGSDWIQWYINKYLNVTQWIMSSWMWQWIFYHLVKIFFEGHVFFPVCHHILNDSMNDYYWSYQEADYQPQRVPKNDY